MIKKILIIILLLFVSGCSNKKCLKLHVDSNICTGVFIVNNVPIVQSYPCLKVVCDEYGFKESEV